MRSARLELQWNVQEQLLRRNVKRFRGGLVFQGHSLLYHSTLGLRVIKERRMRSVRPEPLWNVQGHNPTPGALPIRPPVSAKKKSYPYPHGGVRSVHQKSICLTQSTLGPYVVQLWSRNTSESGPNETLVLHRVDRVSIYLTESTYKVVLQKSIPPQIRQLILCISNNRG